MRLVFTLVMGLGFQSLVGEVMLKPPFQREWGEAPTALLQWAGKVELDVTVELPAAEPDLQIFTFQQEGGGIPGEKWKAAKSIEARYFRDQLYELTVNFEFPGKTPEEVRKRFYDVKRDLEKNRGKFRLNGRSQSVEDDFLTRKESFHYEPAAGVFLLMAYSSVEDRLRQKGEGRYSVVYHNGRLGPSGKKGTGAAQKQPLER